MRTVSDKDLAKSLTSIHGKLNKSSLNLVSIIKNEAFFLKAWLDHYRNLGVEQFILIDDGSDDGSLEYLCDQPDCVVLQSPFKYGQEIMQRSRRTPWRINSVRAGIKFKSLLPSKYSRGTWCIYADPDEFLLLPRSISPLNTATNWLDNAGVGLVAGSVVEFYPQSIDDMLTSAPPPSSFDELLALSPYFDKRPLIHIDRSGNINRLNKSASGRLFDTFGIETDENKAKSSTKKHYPSNPMAIGSATHKVPLHKPSWRIKLKSGHKGTVTPSNIFMPCVAHFKFTPDMGRRTQEALRTRAWSRGSAKYTRYELLFQEMRRCNGSFLGPDSVAFESARDLEDSGCITMSLE